MKYSRIVLIQVFTYKVSQIDGVYTTESETGNGYYKSVGFEYYDDYIMVVF